MKELLLRYDEDAGAWREVKEPYITIEIETEEDFNFIQDAIAKQTAKKPLDITEPVVKWGICPVCKGLPEVLGRPQRVLESFLYCPQCGQRLDWSETK